MNSTFFSGEIVALALLVFSFLLLLLDPVMKEDPRLLFAGWFTLAAHHCAAFAEAFLFRLNPAMGDHLMFHAEAVRNPGMSVQGFSNFLSVVYGLFGPSMLLGEECSILMYAFGLLVFLRIFKMLHPEKDPLVPVLLFGALPSVVIHTSLTLREAYQVFFFLASLGATVAFKRTGNAVYLAGFVLANAFLISLHQGLALFSLLNGGFTLLLVSTSRSTMATWVFVAALTAAPILLPRTIASLTSESAVLREISQGKGLEYTQKYREALAAADARSEYGIRLDGASLVTMIWALPVNVLLYMVSPMPWQIRSPLDVYAFAEVLLRLLLLRSALRSLQTAPQHRREELTYVLLASLSLECIWALGTTNWGTAIRHHSVAYGGLLLASGMERVGVSSETATPGASLQGRRRKQGRPLLAGSRENPI